MRVGINKAANFIEFMEELEFVLREEYNGFTIDWKNKFIEYRKRLVFILDNASIHTDSTVQEFFANWKFMALTLPPYTPQFNPIELVFRMIKARISRTIDPAE